MDPGEVSWALRTPGGVERSLHTIDAAVGAALNEKSAAFSDRSELTSVLRSFERDETKELRKKTQLPLDAPSPKTLCWMEIR